MAEAEEGKGTKVMGYAGQKTKVKTERIEGHDVDFFVDDTGQWFANAAILEGSSLGKTIQEARARVTVRLRRATVNLEIKAHIVNVLPQDELDKRWHDRGDSSRANNIRPITLTGISQRGGDVLYRLDDLDTDGKNHKRKPYQSHTDPDSIGVVCRRLTVAEQDEYRKVRDTYDESREALDRWVKDHKIENVAVFLEEKIAEAVDRITSADSELDEIATDPRLKPAPKKKARR